VIAIVEAYLAFRAALRAALRQQSPSALRAVFGTWIDPGDRARGRLIALPDQALEPIIRSLILAEPQLADLHADARRWLDDHPAASPPPRRVVPADRRRRRAARTAGTSPAASTPA
jgi:hypothetical protein